MVFVDDIDRCRADTTTEVFEAVNLFLSGLTAGTGLHARFVIGLDPAVVAAHLDRSYADLPDPAAAQYGDDPTPGWAFLRKLIQLPVTMPHVSDVGIRDFVGQVTGAAAGPPDLPDPAPAADPGPTDPPALGTVQRRRQPPERSTTEPVRPPDLPVETIAWRTVERHPDVQDLLIRRLADQPDRSIREAKRMLNVWQLYERMLAGTEPVTQPADAIRRARHLILLAEIITRWPALQRPLHHRVDGGQRGLHLLATAAANDAAWTSATDQLRIDTAEHAGALVNLRRLLREQDGAAIADLAAQLL